MSWRNQYRKSMEIGRLKKELIDMKKSFDIAVKQAIRNKEKPNQTSLEEVYAKSLASLLAAQQQQYQPLTSLLLGLR